MKKLLFINFVALLIILLSLVAKQLLQDVTDDYLFIYFFVVLIYISLMILFNIKYEMPKPQQYDNNHIPYSHKFEENEIEAIVKFQAGIPFRIDTGEDNDAIVAGYGRFSQTFKTFEYPLPAVYISQIFKTHSTKEWIDRLNSAKTVAELLK